MNNSIYVEQFCPHYGGGGTKYYYNSVNPILKVPECSQTLKNLVNSERKKKYEHREKLRI